MDSQGGALLPLAARFRLRGSQARCECRSIPWAGRGIYEQKSSDGALFQEEVTYLDRTLMKKPVPNGFAEAARIILGWQACLEKDLLQRRKVGRGILTKAQLFATRLAPKGELLTHAVPRVWIRESQCAW